MHQKQRIEIFKKSRRTSDTEAIIQANQRTGEVEKYHIYQSGAALVLQGSQRREGGQTS